MARTIEEIKAGMTTDFMKMEAVQKAYGLDGSKGFADCFSIASIENVIFYVFAVAVWALERLFDFHKADVEARIDLLEPHTLRWYVNKAKNFRYGHSLELNSDQYGEAALKDEAAKIVKYAVATEDNTVIYVKVARDDPKNPGSPGKLTPEQLNGLVGYLNEVKDAGVSVKVRNEAGDNIRLRLLIYYNPVLMDGNGYLTDKKTQPVNDTVKRLIEELPFNGMFRKSDLLTALQAIDAVEVADILGAEVCPDGGERWTTINGYTRPESGYYTNPVLNVNYIAYDPLKCSE